MNDAFNARMLGEALPENERPMWTNHPTFAGVRLSERVAARDTEGAFKTLVVRRSRRADGGASLPGPDRAAFRIRRRWRIHS